MAVFSYANLRHMDSQEKRDAILTSAAWKQWTILGGMFTSIVVLPGMMFNGVYEALGPNTVAPMVKTVGFGAAAWV
jgi:hypothetical protein